MQASQTKPLFSHPAALTTNATLGSGLISWVVCVWGWDHLLCQKATQLFGTMISGKKCILYHSSVYIYTDIMYTEHNFMVIHSDMLVDIH